MAANQHKGEVELVAGDKTYVLRFSVDAICTLEERLDMGFPAIAQELSDPSKIRISMVRHLLHASLADAHPEVTLKQAGELIGTAGGMAGVLEKVSEAITAAFPTQEASGTKRPRTRLNGQTGLRS